MKKSSLIFFKDKSKKLKCHLLQFLFGALRVKKGGKTWRGPIHLMYPKRDIL